MADLRLKNISVAEIKPERRTKKLFTTTKKNSKKSPKVKERKTIRDMMFDTDSGLPMRPTEDFSDQVDISGRINSDTPHTSNLERIQSRRNSSKDNMAELAKKDFLGQKRENEESNISKRSLKPQVIIENGKIRVERPSYIEIKKKVNEEIRFGNERNGETVDMTNEKFRVTSMSFRKSNHSNKWSDEETDYFYKALSYFGTDFSLLEIILNPRTRNQIKNKFHKEEKVNKERLEEIMKNLKLENMQKFLTFAKEIKRIELVIRK